MHYCNGPSSFAKPARPWGEPFVVATGYFDDETNGFLQCGICGQAYRFDLLHWDEQQDLRIFSLVRLPTGVFETLMDVLTKAYGQPNRKYWVPATANPSLANEVRIAVDQSVTDAAAPDAAAESVLLTEHIERDILALKVLPAEFAHPSDPEEWWRLVRGEEQ